MFQQPFSHLCYWRVNPVLTLPCVAVSPRDVAGILVDVVPPCCKLTCHNLSTDLSQPQRLRCQCCFSNARQHLHFQKLFVKHTSPAGPGPKPKGRRTQRRGEVLGARNGSELRCLASKRCAERMLPVYLGPRAKQASHINQLPLPRCSKLRHHKHHKDPNASP